VERREFIGKLAATPALSVAGAAATAQQDRPSTRPLSVTVLRTGTPSPSLDRRVSAIEFRQG
jgi:hypothetical protein